LRQVGGQWRSSIPVDSLNKWKAAAEADTKNRLGKTAGLPYSDGRFDLKLYDRVRLYPVVPRVHEQSDFCLEGQTDSLFVFKKQDSLRSVDVPNLWLVPFIALVMANRPSFDSQAGFNGSHQNGISIFFSSPLLQVLLDSMGVRRMLISTIRGVQKFSALPGPGKNDSANCWCRVSTFTTISKAHTCGTPEGMPTKFSWRIGFEGWMRKIVHIDMDAFYASVEQRDEPQFKVTEEKLKGLDIHTIADLRRLDLPALESRFGRYGVRLYELARGIDESLVVPDRPTQSISAGDTFERDVPLPATEPMIRKLAELTWAASRKESRVARTVQDPHPQSHAAVCAYLLQRADDHCAFAAGTRFSRTSAALSPRRSRP
jgi:hypothetical protein